MTPANIFTLILCASWASLMVCGCTRSSASPRPAIAVVPMGTTDEYWKAIHAGAIKAGKDNNVDIIWQGTMRHDDRSGQIDVVQAMIVRGVEGIVLAPVDNMALRGPVEDAYRNKIPVVIIDTDLHSDKYVSFIATNNYEGGSMAGEYMAKLLKDNGRVAMLRGTEGNASTDNRERGFLDAIAKHPGIKVVSANQHGGSTSETAYKAAENILAPLKLADGSMALDGVFAPSEGTVFGMLRALQDGGVAGKVHFIGFDSSAKLNKALADKQIDALVLQNPVLMGYLGVQAVIDRNHGKKVEPKVDVPATLITQDNYREPAMKVLLEPELPD